MAVGKGCKAEPADLGKGLMRVLLLPLRGLPGMAGSAVERRLLAVRSMDTLGLLWGLGRGTLAVADKQGARGGWLRARGKGARLRSGVGWFLARRVCSSDLS